MSVARIDWSFGSLAPPSLPHKFAQPIVSGVTTPTQTDLTPSSKSLLELGRFFRSLPTPTGSSAIAANKSGAILLLKRRDFPIQPLGSFSNRSQRGFYRGARSSNRQL